MDIEALERAELKKKGRLVAVLFLLAIAMVLVFAYWMGAFGLGISKHFYVDYNFAGGLERGSTVRLAGIKVGRVAAIEFISENAGVRAEASGEGAFSDHDTPHLRLKIEVSRSAFAQINEDSKFYINLAGLIGERYVEVVPGVGAPVNNGHQFRGVDPPRIDQLFSQGYGIFGDLRSFFQENRADLKEMLHTLNSFSRNLSKVLGNITPAQSKQLNKLLLNLADTSSDLKDLVGHLNAGARYAHANGARESWDSLLQLLEKANKIGLNDVRRLMLEDGVRVRLLKNEVPRIEEEAKEKK